MTVIPTTRDINSQPPPQLSNTRRETVTPQTIAIILASVACSAIGQLILKAGMNSLGPLQLSFDTLLQMLSNPLLILGFGFFGVGTLLWLAALINAELSFAYPFLSLTYMAVLIGGALLFHEQVTMARLVGFVVIVLGVWIVANSEKNKGK